MGECGPGHAEQFLFGIADHSAKRHIYLDEAPVHACHANAGRSVFEDGAETLFAFQQRLCRAAALGNVGAEADVAHEFTGGRESGLGARAHKTPLAIGAATVRLGFERKVFAHGALECGYIGGLIVGAHHGLPSPPVNLFGGDAEELAAGAVDELDLAGDAGDPHDRWGAVGHGAETRFCSDRSRSVLSLRRATVAVTFPDGSLIGNPVTLT